MITNDGVYYAEKSMEEKGLKPAGIISADMVRAISLAGKYSKRHLRLPAVSRRRLFI